MKLLPFLYVLPDFYLSLLVYFHLHVVRCNIGCIGLCKSYGCTVWHIKPIAELLLISNNLCDTPGFSHCNYFSKSSLQCPRLRRINRIFQVNRKYRKCKLPKWLLKVWIKNLETLIFFLTTFLIVLSQQHRYFKLSFCERIVDRLRSLVPFFEGFYGMATLFLPLSSKILNTFSRLQPDITFSITSIIRGLPTEFSFSIMYISPWIDLINKSYNDFLAIITINQVYLF